MSDPLIRRLSDLLAQALTEAELLVETLQAGDLELTSRRHLRYSTTVKDTTKLDVSAFRKYSTATDLNRESIRITVLPSEHQSRFDQSLQELVAEIENLDVVHGQQVRHSLPGVIKGMSGYAISAKGPNIPVAVSDISDVARYLLVQAALTNADTASASFVGWACGEELAFETCALIGGIRINEPIFLERGVHFEALPPRAADLPARLPGHAAISAADYLGRVLMVAECSLAPAVSSPEDRRGPTGTWALGRHSIQDYCAALSVICDADIQEIYVWEDYGRYSTSRTSSAITTSSAPRWARPRNDDVLVGKREVACAFNLLGQCEGRKNILVAINQWRKSKRYMANNVEQLIYLRTALEAILLAGGNRSELKYRLSLYGAFMMGTNGPERKQIFEDLGKFYNLASAAVHEGEVKPTEQHRLTLQFAQDFCRRAILAKAQGPRSVEWDSLILAGNEREA